MQTLVPAKTTMAMHSEIVVTTPSSSSTAAIRSVRVVAYNYKRQY